MVGLECIGGFVVMELEANVVMSGGCCEVDVVILAYLKNPIKTI